MPLSHRWTLTRYLIEERRRYPQASGDLNALILDISLACKAIARIVSFGEYLSLRLAQPHFANARSVRNALDRARLRQASRLFAERDRELTREDLTTIAPQDIRASRLFAAHNN